MPVAIGDIPEGTLRAEVITHAALASDGGSAAYGIGGNDTMGTVLVAGVFHIKWRPI